MESNGQYVKFFRFRSPAYVEQGGLSLLWLIQSLEFIDFSREVLIQESFATSFYSKGGFDYNTIKDFPFDEYEIVIKETNRIKNLKPETDDNGRSSTDIQSE